MRSECNKISEPRSFSDSQTAYTNALPSREEMALSLRSTSITKSIDRSAEILFGGGFSFAGREDIYLSSEQLLAAKQSDKTAPKSTDKTKEKEPEIIPTQSDKWEEGLTAYENKLTKKLGHQPSQSDYAREVINPKTSGLDAVYAAIEFAFNIRDRKVHIADFAEDAAPKMIERRDASLLKPGKPENLDADAIHQNYPDSCPFVAALIGLARTESGKKFLAKMVKENADGSYVVTFPGDTAHSILVPRLTAAEKMIGSSTDQKYLLPTVLEKAYGIYLNGKQPAGERTIVSAEACKFAYGNYDDGLKTLTGNAVEHIGTRRAGNPLAAIGEGIFQNAIREAQDKDAVAIVAIKGKPTDVALADLHPNHAYVVTNFDKANITMSDPTVAGSRITMTWRQFNDNCNELMIQKR